MKNLNARGPQILHEIMQVLLNCQGGCGAEAPDFYTCSLARLISAPLTLVGQACVQFTTLAFEYTQH